MKFLKRFLLLLSLLTLPFQTGTVYAQDDPGKPVYIVQSGDTLSLIAYRFGVTIDDLIHANSLPDPNSLDVGSSIVIPNLTGIHGELVLSPVAFGETLERISSSTLVPLPLIAKINRLTGPGEVYAGTTLITPLVKPEESLYPISSLSSTETWLEKSARLNRNPWEGIPGSLFSPSMILPGQMVYGEPAGDAKASSMVNLNVKTFQISPLPMAQGTTIVVKAGVQEGTTLLGHFLSHEIPFTKITPEQQISLLGVPALQDPGVYDFSIDVVDSSGQKETISNRVLIEPGAFIQESVTGVDASTIDPATIEQENTILSQILPVNELQQWDTSFQYPVDNPCFASSFGNRRSYNEGSYYYYHTGMDFTVCADNLNIYAAAPGTVVFSGPLPIKGNFTVIDHGLGVYSGYAHQSSFSIAVGDHVDKGQLIGQIGNSGRSVGPHLHWEIWIHNVPVNPVDWIEKSYP